MEYKFIVTLTTKEGQSQTQAKDDLYDAIFHLSQYLDMDSAYKVRIDRQ